MHLDGRVHPGTLTRSPVERGRLAKGKRDLMWTLTLSYLTGLIPTP